MSTSQALILPDLVSIRKGQIVVHSYDPWVGSYQEHSSFKISEPETFSSYRYQYIMSIEGTMVTCRSNAMIIQIDLKTRQFLTYDMSPCMIKFGTYILSHTLISYITFSPYVVTLTSTHLIINAKNHQYIER